MHVTMGKSQGLVALPAPNFLAFKAMLQTSGVALNPYAEITQAGEHNCLNNRNSALQQQISLPVVYNTAHQT